MMAELGHPGTHLQSLILDANAAKDQKIACLKTLRIVVKNLADPQKNADPKYRQLNMSNEKVKSKLSPCPSGIDYMKAIGFEVVQEGDGSEFLRMTKTINLSHMQACLAELNAAVDMLVPRDVGTNPGFTEEKKTPEGIIIQKSSSAATKATTNVGRMSEKQKARLLMEKKRQREIEEAKAARKKTQDQIKQDKYVRENDPNWESKQSAACVKSGNGISTFRDKVKCPRLCVSSSCALL